jgi:hypothetical protein
MIVEEAVPGIRIHLDVVGQVLASKALVTGKFASTGCHDLSCGRSPQHHRLLLATTSKPADQVEGVYQIGSLGHSSLAMSLPSLHGGEES